MIEVRVAGLLRRNGRLLLIEHEKQGRRYWVIPGGRVEEGESLAEALAREFREELGLAVEVGDLVLVNDFLAADRHVVNLYFAVEPSEPSAQPTVRGGGVVRRARFVAGDGLGDIDLRPAIAEVLAEYVRSGRIPQVYLGRR